MHIIAMIATAFALILIGFAPITLISIRESFSLAAIMALIALGLAGVAVVTWSAYMLNTARRTRQNAADRAASRRAIAQEPDGDDARIGEAMLPTYRTLLMRNAIVCAVYAVPITAMTSAVLYGFQFATIGNAGNMGALIAFVLGASVYFLIATRLFPFVARRVDRRWFATDAGVTLAAAAIKQQDRTSATPSVAARPSVKVQPGASVTAALPAEEISTQSLEARIEQRIVVLFLGIGVISIASLVGASQMAIALNVDEQTRRSIIDGLATLFLLAFGVIFLTPARRFFMPKSILTRTLPPFLAAYKMGDSARMVEVTERAMRRLRNWETMQFTATAYAVAGRLEDALQLLDELNVTLSRPTSEFQQKANPFMLTSSQGIRVTILIARDRMDEAVAVYDRMLPLADDKNPPFFNTGADLRLRQGDLAGALNLQQRAKAAYVKSKTDPSSTHLALEAWIAALQDRRTEADRLIMMALAKAQPDGPFEVSSILEMHGQIVLVNGDRATARTLFERGSALDPTGLGGTMNRLALAKLDGAGGAGERR